jgi:hypothetical protein
MQKQNFSPSWSQVPVSPSVEIQNSPKSATLPHHALANSQHRHRQTPAFVVCNSPFTPTCSICSHVTCSCGTAYCYRCLSSAEENLKKRGGERECKCGSGWSGFCGSLDNDEEIKRNLKLEPYPHDQRCGCHICPECLPGQPCGTCEGTCCVCLGRVRPGPTDLGTNWTPDPY